MKNKLWFTLNAQGYCVRYQTNESGSEHYSSGFIIGPTDRVNFPSLVETLAHLGDNKRFYRPGVSVSFDSNGEMPIPEKEKEAIRAVVDAMEKRTRENTELENRLEKIANLAEKRQEI